jgi:3-oxoacyl-[acyl-carrier-protein] synthase II
MVTACTTSTHCIGEAAKSIRYGEADVMIAGGSEATVTELAIGGFASARALSTRNDDPAARAGRGTRTATASCSARARARWCSRNTSTRRARGAKIYCELVGYGVSADAHHMTAPPEDGDGGYRAMRNALKDAIWKALPSTTSTRTGTSTPLGDLAETLAIKKLLGARAPAWR